MLNSKNPQNNACTTFMLLNYNNVIVFYEGLQCLILGQQSTASYNQKPTKT